MVIDSIFFTNQLSQRYVLGGWTVTVTAPDGVQMFDVQRLELDIIETENANVKRPIAIRLEAGV